MANAQASLLFLSRGSFPPAISCLTPEFHTAHGVWYLVLVFLRCLIDAVGSQAQERPILSRVESMVLVVTSEWGDEKVGAHELFIWSHGWHFPHGRDRLHCGFVRDSELDLKSDIPANRELGRREGATARFNYRDSRGVGAP
jgi:hypothetical protein